MFTKFYYRYKDIACKYNSTYKQLIKNCISHPVAMNNVRIKIIMFKSDTSKFVKFLDNCNKMKIYG